MKYLWLIIVAWLVLGANECSNCPSSQEMNARIIDKARKVVLSSDVEMTSKEIEFINKNIPKMNFYGMIGSCSEYGDYNISWDINNIRIYIRGHGGVYELNNAKIFRVKI